MQANSTPSVEQRLAELEAEVSQLRLQEARFRALFENHSDGLAMLDGEGVMLALSPFFARRAGLPEGIAVGRSILDLAPAAELPEWTTRLRDAKAAPRRPIKFETFIVTGTDQWVWVEATLINYLHEPKVQAIIVSFRDITQRKQADEQVRRALESLATVLDEAPHAIVSLGPGGVIEGWNEGATHLFGWQPKEVLGKPLAAALGPQPEEFLYLVERSQRGLLVRQQRSEVRSRAGSLATVSVSLVPLPTAEAAARTILFLEDVTEQERAQEKLRRSELRYRRLLTDLHDLVFERDLEGRILSVNAAITRVLGWPPEELIGQSFLPLVHPEDAPRALAELESFGEAGTAAPPDAVVYRLRHADGGYRHLEVASTLVLEKGKPTRVQAIAHDVTDRIEALDAARRSEQRYRELLANIPDIVFETDRDGKLVSVNPALTRVLGWEPREMLGQPLFEELRSSDQSVLGQASARLLGTAADEERPRLMRARHKDGGYRLMEVLARPKREGGRVVGQQGVSRDVTERAEVERKLHENQRFVQQMANASPNLLYVYDLQEQRNLFINSQLQPLLGYRPEQIQQPGFLRSRFHPEDQKPLGTTAGLGDSEIGEREVRIQHADGRWRWFFLREVVFKRNDLGRPTQILGVAIDITDRKRVEAELVGKQHLLESIAEVLPVHIYIQDLEHSRVAFSSPYIQRLLGYTSEELLRMDSAELWSWVHPEDQEAAMQKLAQRPHMAGDDVLVFEARLRHKLGDYRWIRSREVVYERNAQGEVTKILGSSVDITQEVRDRRSLEEQSQFLERLASMMPVTLSLVDLVGQTVQYVSPHVTQLLGYAPAELSGQPLSRLVEQVYGPEMPRMQEAREQHFRSGSTAPLIVQHRARTKSGSWRWLETHEVVLERDAAGNPSKLLSASVDIDEQKRADDALAASEERLKQLVEYADDLFVLYDLDQRVQYFKAPSYVGLPESAVVGQLPEAFLPQDLAQRVRAQNGEVMRTRLPANFENTFPMGSGSVVFQDHVYPVFDAAGELTGVGRICRNITQQKRAETERQELQQLLERISALSPGIHYVLDVQERKYLFMGKSFERLLGYPVERVLQEGERFFEEIMHPDDWPEQQRLAAAWRNMPDNEIMEAEFRYRHAAGQYRWLRFQTVVFARDERGQVRQRMGVAMDVTAERAAEEFRRGLEAKMQQSQKLESLGILAGGIAHDFNNLLTAILGNASLLTLNFRDGSPERELLQEIELASRRAAELTQQMMAYAGKERPIFQPVDLNEVAREIHKLLRKVLSPKADVRLDLQERLSLIAGDGTQLRQVLMNLLKNASEALEDRPGKICLRTSEITLTEVELASTLLPEAAKPGRFVQVDVEDSGCGMTRATLDRVFDPFFTTKFTGRGLGLSAVVGIVRAHHGTLRVHTAPGEGTRFQLFFPLAVQGLRAAEVKPTRERTPHRRILVMEDNASVADLTRRILLRSGYSPVLAANGEAGLAAFTNAPRQFDVAIVDLSLPGKSGDDICEALHALRPELPIVLMSGFFNPAVVERFQGRPRVHLLNKPFTPSQLLQTLQSFSD